MGIDEVFNKGRGLHPDVAVQELPPQKTKQKRIHLKHNIIMIAQVKAPPIRSGTNRYRNMQVVLSCHTVGEALQKLKALSPAPGSATDIKLAERVGAIKLLQPTEEKSHLA